MSLSNITKNVLGSLIYQSRSGNALTISDYLQFTGSVDPGPNNSEPGTWPVIISAKNIPKGNWIYFVENRYGFGGSPGDASYAEHRLKLNASENRRVRGAVFVAGVTYSNFPFLNQIKVTSQPYTIAVEGWIRHTTGSGSAMYAILNMIKIGE